MEQQEQSKSETLKEDRKVQAENMRLKKYIKELENVSKEIEVKGYFLWSLFDNFEWSYGLSKRFGLVYIDYDNGNRIKKDSYFEYKNIVKNGGV